MSKASKAKSTVKTHSGDEENGLEAWRAWHDQQFSLEQDQCRISRRSQNMFFKASDGFS